MNSSFFDVDSGDISRSGRVRKRSTKLVDYDPQDEAEAKSARKERRDSGQSAARRKTKVMVTPNMLPEVKQEVIDVKTEILDDMGSEAEDDLQGYEVDGYDTSGGVADTVEIKAGSEADDDDDDDDDDFSNLIMVANDVDDDEFDDDDEADDGGRFSDGADDPLVIDESAGRPPPPPPPAQPARRVKATKPPRAAAKKVGGQRKNATKMWKQQRMTRKDKGQTRITAYLLWAREVRDFVVHANPSLDFSQVNKRLGAMWNGLPDAKKYNFKRKAQRINSRAQAKEASTSAKMKSTGKGKGRSTGAKKPTDGATEATTSETAGKQPSMPPPSMSDATSMVNPTNYRVCTTQPLDLAAHMVLLGESLGVIGQKLRDHDGQIAVSGSLSVLLDSLLCALVPLVALTKQVPELDGCDERDLVKTLDNIAYFMPGL